MPPPSHAPNTRSLNKTTRSFQAGYAKVRLPRCIPLLFASQLKVPESYSASPKPLKGQVSLGPNVEEARSDPGPVRLEMVPLNQMGCPRLPACQHQSRGLVSSELDDDDVVGSSDGDDFTSSSSSGRKGHHSWQPRMSKAPHRQCIPEQNFASWRQRRALVI